ncbi:hypothetical protein [Gluconobacter japonicus]|uniref:hypothetical protein n=1 Tax=Gluconobacter japonicus TaxID=376620 RepID=UPI000A9B89DC|nr:hypothetical protein [Gluconobacter japonicus]
MGHDVTARLSEPSTSCRRRTAYYQQSDDSGGMRTQLQRAIVGIDQSMTLAVYHP